LAVDSSGRPYFTMKLVSGRTLRDLVRASEETLSDPDTLRDLLYVFLKVCDAVAFAHSRGIVHCDIKPENIMVGAFGEVYLMDWGIAWSRGVGQGDTAAATVPRVPSRAGRTGIRG